jgi:hypothetical protein
MVDNMACCKEALVARVLLTEEKLDSIPEREQNLRDWSRQLGIARCSSGTGNSSFKKTRLHSSRGRSVSPNGRQPSSSMSLEDHVSKEAANAVVANQRVAAP